MFHGFLGKQVSGTPLVCLAYAPTPPAYRDDVVPRGAGPLDDAVVRLGSPIRRSVVLVMMLLLSAGANIHLATADPETGAGSSEPATPSAATAAPAAVGVTLEIVPGQVQTHDELRVNTGKERDLGNGQKEPIYVLQRPRLGAVFLEIVLYVSTEGAPFTLARQDVSLLLPNTEVPPVPLRSLAVESGLLPEEVTIAKIDSQGIVRLMFEVERERLDSRVVQLGTLNLGTVAEIRAQVGE